MLRKPIPIGIDDYREMIEKEYYYVDKTLLIKDLLDNQSKVCLITRPRRFGKTLGLSTIRTFFECVVDEKGNPGDNRHYFIGKKIMSAGEKYTSHMGKYPVIKLSLKSAKQPDFDIAYRCLRDEIAKEYRRHKYVLESDVLTEEEKNRYYDLMVWKGDYQQYTTAIEYLSDCLRRYHGEKSVILIDEYDVPLEHSYFHGFYEPMVAFIRSLFESALKTNDHLAFAVVTGCLRISKESIFTGLNNLEVISILNLHYAEYFGFTPEEVEDMLIFYGVEEKKEEAKQWYDGYLFGHNEVYNPWSVINYVKTADADIRSFPRPYWSNTSSNSIVRELVEHADFEAKRELETLIAGGTIEKPVHEDITYDSIYQSQDNLWNFLFFTGYLKAVSQRFEVNTIYLTMKIPNQEVRYIYQNTIREWFEKSLKGKKMECNILQDAILSGDCEKMEDAIRQLLAGSISYYDNAEKFYHGFLAGVLSGIEWYEMFSNRESGDGRPDIVLAPTNENLPVIIVEVKKADSFELMESRCDAALRQIEEKHYDADYLAEGYKKFMKYGVCFYKKSCRVKANLTKM